MKPLPRDHFRFNQRCYRLSCLKLARLHQVSHGHFFCSFECAKRWRFLESEIAASRIEARYRSTMPGVRYDRIEDIRSCPARTGPGTICGETWLRNLNDVGVVCLNGHTTFVRHGLWEREMARPQAGRYTD